MSVASASTSRAVARAPVSRLRAWWLEPRLTWWQLLVLGFLLFLRKPHALHTPQLWAEDGSIFLAFNDLDGARAFVTPYMGYLHTIPRLVAWTASRLLDPAAWPACYNGVSFLIWLAVIARLFSPRLNLPGKPWLALAFLLGPNTGEILFNITNVQWITAFVFVQQSVIARPRTNLQRGGDLVWLALAGLTGPFVIALAPLFLWRWWRDRHPDNLAALLLVTACAGVQGWLILQTGPRFDYQAKPFDAWSGLVVVVRRLLVWPAFGPHAAHGLPRAIIGFVGGGMLLGLLAWSLRPDPGRELRARIVAAFGLILIAGILRTRPDTWDSDDLNFSDRYFCIPRVLLVWLLVWEFETRPRAIAWCARLLCLSGAIVHLRDYRMPAPTDYHWAQHVEPIRRGVPANIPTLPEGWMLEYRGRGASTRTP